MDDVLDDPCELPPGSRGLFSGVIQNNAHGQYHTEELKTGSHQHHVEMHNLPADKQGRKGALIERVQRLTLSNQVRDRHLNTVFVCILIVHTC